MRLIEIQFSARFRLGDVGDLIGDLEAAVAAYPLQEGLWELLITALYWAGRQADALTTYQRVRNRLSDELGRRRASGRARSPRPVREGPRCRSAGE